MGRKCCSSTTTVMPFAVVILVGAMSAAREEGGRNMSMRRTPSTDNTARRRILPGDLIRRYRNITRLGFSLMSRGGYRIRRFRRQRNENAHRAIIVYEILLGDSLDVFRGNRMYPF